MTALIAARTRAIPAYRETDWNSPAAAIENEAAMVRAFPNEFIGKRADFECCVEKHGRIVFCIEVRPGDDTVILQCQPDGRPSTCRRCLPTKHAGLRWPTKHPRPDRFRNREVVSLIVAGVPVEGLEGCSPGPVLQWGPTVISQDGRVFYPTDVVGEAPAAIPFDRLDEFPAVLHGTIPVFPIAPFRAGPKKRVVIVRKKKKPGGLS